MGHVLKRVYKFQLPSRLTERFSLEAKINELCSLEYSQIINLEEREM